jgi:ribose 5-phosphate isomerase A
MNEAAKLNAAKAAVALVEDGMRLGLGTGSTAQLILPMLGAMVASGMRLVGVPTSERTAKFARRAGVPLTTLAETPELDLAIDGADEVDPEFNLIKGGGGALLREKVVASCARRFVVVVDRSKLVDQLGVFPLPIEVSPMAATPVARRIGAHGREVTLRSSAKNGGPYVTDEGHHILDCRFGRITDSRTLARTLADMPGVLEHGLFLDMAELVIVGGETGAETLRRR